MAYEVDESLRQSRIDRNKAYVIKQLNRGRMKQAIEERKKKRAAARADRDYQAAQKAIEVGMRRAEQELAKAQQDLEREKRRQDAKAQNELNRAKRDAKRLETERSKLSRKDSPAWIRAHAVRFGQEAQVKMEKDREHKARSAGCKSHITSDGVCLKCGQKIFSDNQLRQD